MDESTKVFRAAIISAIPIELSALDFHFSRLHRDDYPDGSVYRYGYLESHSTRWKIYIVESQPGQIVAGQEITTCLTNIDPSILLFIGIAGGDPDKTDIGDLVIPESIFYYESGKVTRGGYLPRFPSHSPSRRLMQAARFEARSKTWQRRIPTGRPNIDVPVWFGPIASGDKVIASTTSHEWLAIKSHNDKCLAVEMEGFVFLLSSFNKERHAIVIRGISDLLDDKNSQHVDHDTRQRTAAERAAAFGIELVANLNTSFLGGLAEVGVKIHFQTDSENAMFLFNRIRDLLAPTSIRLIEIKPIDSFYLTLQTMASSACLIRSGFYGGCLSEYLSTTVIDVESQTTTTGDDDFDRMLANLERINADNDRVRAEAKSALRTYVKRQTPWSKVLLRLTGRALFTVQNEQVLQVGSVIMNLGSREVWRNGSCVHLSDNEFRCLEGFLKKPGIVVSRDQIEELIWGAHGKVGPGAVANVIRRLRKALMCRGEDDLIVTTRHHGYRFYIEEVA